MQAVITQPSDQWTAQPTAIKVLVADDHPLIIAGIRRTIEHLDDIEVVGEAHSGAELLQLVERRGPEMVLMDLHMPGVNGPTGVELIEWIRREHPAVKVVVLSACDDRPTIDAVLHAGASAYVLKSAHTVDIASVLRQASSGAVFHAPSHVPATNGAPAAPSLPADRPRALDPVRRRLGQDHLGDQPRPVDQRAHDQVSPHQHLPQARGRQPRRRRPLRARARDRVAAPSTGPRWVAGWVGPGHAGSPAGHDQRMNSVNTAAAAHRRGGARTPARRPDRSRAPNSGAP